MASDTPVEDAAWGGDLDSEANDDYQPDIEFNDEQKQDSNSDDANITTDFGDAGDDLGDDGTEYDPEAIGVPPSGSSASQPKPTPPPRTTGGFIVSDDSDSDADDDQVADATSNGAPREADVTPSASAAGSQLEPVVEAASPKSQLENGSHAASSVTSNAVQAGPSVPVPSQAFDRTTDLEKRVKEDPRGDMDAWLDLIDEYRRRNNMDEVRSVYNQFLEVFPQSVCSAHGFRLCLLPYTCWAC
jgi:cleavage stimulation factor subunit 3